MTVSGPRAPHPACAGPGAAGGVVSGTALSGLLLSGLLVSGTVLVGPASAASPLAVLVGPVAAGLPPLTARPIARNPFLPLAGPGADAPAGEGTERVLRRGDTGDDVRRLQQRLAPSVGSTPVGSTPVDSTPVLVVDGVFGPRTAAAVVAFQSAHGLVADGLVGPSTWDALAAEGGR